jgi:hypothetical protein
VERLIRRSPRHGERGCEQPASLDGGHSLAASRLTCVDVLVTTLDLSSKIFFEPEYTAGTLRLDQVCVFRRSCPSTDQKLPFPARELRRDPRFL